MQRNNREELLVSSKHSLTPKKRRARNRHAHNLIDEMVKWSITESFKRIANDPEACKQIADDVAKDFENYANAH